ncbi:hypothetical protein F5I97DRAFT_1846921 [Phlebopus sp. FC_14]|nr:hypothetical protein F5I97DRAFT_1846921 [Phlebopus sp. FC_14]
MRQNNNITYAGYHTTLVMAHKGQKAAATHPRAARHTHLPPKDPKIQPQVNSDTDDDCGYAGGVNCNWSDSEYEPDSDSDWSDSDSDESVVELEGEELERNLTELQQELEALQKKTQYKEVTVGYTGRWRPTGQVLQ